MNTIKFYPHNEPALIKELGKEKLMDALRRMLLIRNLEVRGEAAYQAGKIGGFFHSYMGQEAVQTACIDACGNNNWWITTYRCHALVLLLGATPNEIMAELFGRVSGNAKGHGGSMHMYADHMLGGFGIVGEHLPVAAGAAFALKYKDVKDKIAICFLGDGAVAQGTFHESLNLCSLWDLPCLFIIENNHWGMGTSVQRAICIERLAEKIAPSYNIKGYTLDGMDYFNCYNGFAALYNEVKTTGRPVLVEAITERFRGHSISDPGLYRTKEELAQIETRDPLLLMKKSLIAAGMLDEEIYAKMNKAAIETILAAIKFADESPWPDIATLGEGVFAP